MKELEAVCNPLSKESSDVLDAVEEPVVLVRSSDRIITYVNPAGARLFELPRSELLGDKCHCAICPADRDKCPILDLGRGLDRSEQEIIVSGDRVKVIKSARKVILEGQEYLLETINGLAGRYMSLLKKVEEVEVFRSFFTNNQKMLFILERPTGRILEPNRAALDFYGYSLNSMKEMTLNDLRDNAGPEKAPLTFENGARFRQTHRLASGELKRIQITMGSMEWNNNGFYSIVEDVTEVEENLNDLEESRLRYESLFTHNHTPILLVDPDTGAIIEANAAALTFYGYTRKEFCSMAVQDLTPLSLEQIRSEIARAHDEKRNYCLWPQRIASGEIRTVEVYEGPIPVNGKKLRYAILHDVTSRVMAENLLAEKTDQLDQLFSNAPVAIHQCGADGRLVRINEASQKLFGYTPAEMIGHRSYEILLPPEKHEQGKRVKKRIQEGKCLNFEGTRRRKDGTFVDVAFIGFPFRDSSEGFGIFGIFQDISLRKQAEKQLENSNKAMKEQYGVLKKAWDQTIELMAYAAELRDPYTAGHQKRVSALSGGIAREMGLPPELVEEVEKAALVHDLGKFEIPSEILCKPGKISKLEMALIQHHPEAGFDILRRIDLPWPLAEIVYQHHERMDGSGYPRGLAGDDILIHARIIAVADVVEAMSSHRPYRAALGLEAALREIESGAGRLYAADVVRACRTLFMEKDFVFAEA